MPDALIVAHGSPGNPDPQEATLIALAAHVQDKLPGWRVRGATLAKEGALASALDGMQAPLIYPFFMAEGWFTNINLPRRLRASGAVGARQLPPFGVDQNLPDLVSCVARAGAVQAGIDPKTALLILAAHGSQVSRTSKYSTLAMAGILRSVAGFANVVTGFVEEKPFLADAARGISSGICLPFFALRAGHVDDDLPAALAEAGFDGPLLRAIGEHPKVPALIAAALARAVR